MILHILIPFDSSIEIDLSVRYTLVDTIEDRGIGRVIEEGTGEDGMHVIVQVQGVKETKESELYSLVKSLGLRDALINEILD
ncbi:MAG: hypothetical protein AAFY41_08255 [Bacteroidota bacterium]